MPTVRRSIEEYFNHGPAAGTNREMFVNLSCPIMAAIENSKCINGRLFAMKRFVSMRVRNNEYPTFSLEKYQMKRRARQIHQSWYFLFTFAIVAVAAGFWVSAPDAFCKAPPAASATAAAPQLNFRAYMIHRGQNDPDPTIHMQALIEFTKANRRKALAYCARQQPPIPSQSCSGGVPFCALIVNRKTDQVVAKACNHGSVNPIFHGEIAAITEFATTLQSQGIPLRDVAGYHDLYTTGEPCAMCMGAIMWAGFHTVYFGSSIDYLNKYFSQIMMGGEELSALWRACRAGSNIVRTQVVGGVLEEQTNTLFKAFGDQFCR
jgi:tRNA(adenine34) deaminase